MRFHFPWFTEAVLAHKICDIKHIKMVFDLIPMVSQRY